MCRTYLETTRSLDVPGRNVRWDRYGNDFDSDATGDFLRMQHSGRAGATGRSVVVSFVCDRVVAVPQLKSKWDKLHFLCNIRYNGIIM